MDAQTITDEERLKQLTAERKDLSTKVRSNNIVRIAEAKKMREGREEKLAAIREKTNQISAKIFAYNKLGKVEKMKVDILSGISQIINSEPEEEKTSEPEVY